MILLRDPLGRPIKRLYFEAEVLDELCERKIADFMNQHCGGFKLPIPTSAIIRMIAAEADEPRTSCRSGPRRGWIHRLLCRPQAQGEDF